MVDQGGGAVSYERGTPVQAVAGLEAVPPPTHLDGWVGE